MKKLKLFYLSLIILPWLTVPFIGKNSFKKFFPSAIFICTFTNAVDLYGQRKKWWHFYKGISPINSMNFYNWGLYCVLSLWMLKMTYGKFKAYFISNTILHIIFTSVGLKYVKRFKIFSLKNMNKFSYFLLLAVREMLLYIFQRLIDFATTNKEINEGK